MADVMTAIAARDLPELRTVLLRRWRPGGPYQRLDPLAANFNAPALAGARLWWVAPDMCELVAHAARSLPPTTLTDDLVPCDFGLVVFATPLAGTDAMDGTTLHSHALLWGTTALVDTPAGQMVRVPADGLGRIENEGTPAVTVALYGHRGDWYPQGRSDWAWHTDTEEPGDDARAASMSEDRRWLAALWLLAAQPLSASTLTYAPRAVRRRLSRAGAGDLATSPVRLVDLRRPQRTAAERDQGDENAEGGRRYNSRWIVVGHWRQQAYGPGRAHRRPVFIAEHVKGPDDRPLILREDVHVLRGSPRDRDASL
jgi:hypothetical protein